MSDKKYVYLTTTFPKGGFGFEYFILPDNKKKCKKAKNDVIEWNTTLKNHNKESEKLTSTQYTIKEEIFTSNDILWHNEYTWYPKIYKST